jgi:uncharacterized phage-associated protein
MLIWDGLVREMNTYQADQVADFFLSLSGVQDNDLSNLKLQKLCYYGQGFLAAMRSGLPLFGETIEAWDHGPVVPALYHKFKVHGASPIPAPRDFDANVINEDDREALSDIHEYYGQFSAWRLRNMTHEERPWIDANRSATNKSIPLASLVEFFTPQIDVEYVGQIYGEAK